MALLEFRKSLDDIAEFEDVAALHRAAAELVERIVTSDRDLAELASECGPRTFDPSREPLAALPRA